MSLKAQDVRDYAKGVFIGLALLFLYYFLEPYVEGHFSEKGFAIKVESELTDINVWCPAQKPNGERLNGIVSCKGNCKLKVGGQLKVNLFQEGNSVSLGYYPPPNTPLRDPEFVYCEGSKEKESFHNLEVPKEQYFRLKKINS